MSIYLPSPLRRCARLPLVVLALGGLSVPPIHAQPPAWLLGDLVPGSGSSNPGGFRAQGDYTFFNATASLGELWRTDGTAAGTVRMNADHNAPILRSAQQPIRRLRRKSPSFANIIGASHNDSEAPMLAARHGDGVRWMGGAALSSPSPPKPAY